MICVKLYKKSMVEPYFFMRPVLFSMKTFGSPLQKRLAKLVGRVITESMPIFLKFWDISNYVPWNIHINWDFNRWSEKIISVIKYICQMLGFLNLICYSYFLFQEFLFINRYAEITLYLTLKYLTMSIFIIEYVFKTCEILYSTKYYLWSDTYDFPPTFY